MSTGAGEDTLGGRSPGLEEAAAQIESLFSSAPVGFAFLDRELRYIRINPLLAEINGLPLEAHLGRSIEEVLPGRIGRGVALLLRRVVETGQPLLNVEIDGATQAAPGRFRHWLASYYPIGAADRGVVGVGAVITEISERKWMEQELQRLKAAAEADRRRVQFLDQVTGGLLDLPMDSAGRLRRLAELLVPELADCCLVELLEGGTLRRVGVGYGEPMQAERLRGSAPGGQALLREVLRAGEPRLLTEVGPPELDGLDALRLLEARSALVVPLGPAAQPFGVATLVFAGSGRRYAEAELALALDLARRAALVVENARLYEEAQRALRSRDELLSIVAHDLRSPLVSIGMGVDGLLADLPVGTTGGPRQLLDLMARSTRRMHRLIEDLLDAAKVEGGRLRLEPRPLELNALVAEAIAVLAPQARSRGVRLSVEQASAPVPVGCDRDRIHQVLSNLAGNALKFTPAHGTVTVRVERVDGQARVAVADSGSGIEPEVLPRLFERFWQGRKTARQGSGLGLYIAKGIVEAHGGRIWAESHPGAGTSFFFTLPLAGPPPGGQPAGGRDQDAPGAGGGPGAAL